MDDPVAAYRAAEHALFSRLGLTFRESNLTVEGRVLRVMETGPASGEPLLFVHGGGGCGALWAPLAAQLAHRRCILMDRPGFGLSAEAPLEGVDFHQHAVTVLAETITALGLERVDVVANSMGALWSLWLAVDRPSRVSSLSLIGTPALTGGTGVPFPMRLLGRNVVGPLMMRLEPPSPRQVHTLWQRLGHDPRVMPDEVHRLMEALELLPSYPSAWRGLLRRVSTLGGPRADVVLPDEALDRVRCPAAVVWGTQDPFGGVAVGRQVAQRLRAPFVVAGQGHLPWLDDPRGCAAGLVVAQRQAVAA